MNKTGFLSSLVFAISIGSFSSCSFKIRVRSPKNTTTSSGENDFSLDDSLLETSGADTDFSQNIGPLSLTVTTLNIGHFTNGASLYPNGTYVDADQYKDSFDSLDSDIITLNENSYYFDEEQTIESSYIYSNMPHYYCGYSRGYNCNAILSKQEIQQPFEKVFDNSSSRYYIDSIIEFASIPIHVITTHLEVDDMNIRQGQIEELLDLVDNYQHFILCGDFNPNTRINGVMEGDPLSQYPNDYAMFTVRGYRIANAGDLGTFNTLVKQEGLSVRPWDNIIVSSSFEITSVTRNDLILSDHYPLTAVIQII